MYNIFLVRHGESEQNNRILDNKFKPDHEIELTYKGMNQAKETGEFLKKYLDEHKILAEEITLWTSPFKRTRQTAKIINKYLNIADTREDEMLTELQFGLFHNLTKQECLASFPAEYNRFELAKRYNGKYYARRPEGESPFDCEIRQRLFIDTIFRDFNGQNNKHLIIVGHGAALTLFRKAFFHYSHEWYENEGNPDNCSVQLIKRHMNRNNEDYGYIFKNKIEKLNNKDSFDDKMKPELKHQIESELKLEGLDNS